VNECCAKPENRVELERRDNGVVVQKCSVCDRRHYEMEVDPVEVGVRLDA
jgi:hypothetical protein